VKIFLKNVKIMLKKRGSRLLFNCNFLPKIVEDLFGLSSWGYIAMVVITREVYVVVPQQCFFT
jgi:hypothetical protein